MVTLILKPISHRDLEPIVIEDALFAIGRREEPFASDASGSAARLSRRHARIFVENDVPYIADLGSLNGTQLNGAPLGREAAVLAPGAEIGLGGEYLFEVDVVAEEPEERTVGERVSTRLILRPVDADSGLDTIVVERFPFLVNRGDELFSQYTGRFPDDVRRISRRQAVILEKGREICVEDLASANGTFVDGARLDEHARPLQDGDVLAFGGERFAYRVAIERYDTTTGQDVTVFAGADGTVAPAVDAEAAGAEGGIPAAEGMAPAPEGEVPLAAAAPSPTRDDADHTRFVDSATSFLDVFCAADDDGQEAGEADTDNRASAKPKRKGRLAQTAAALELSSPRGRTLAAAAVVVVLLGGAFAASYLAGADRRAVEAQLDAGEFAASAAAAQAYLERHPNDATVARWGEEALTRAVLPGWMSSVAAGRFDAAQAQLDQAQRQHPAIRGGTEILTLLGWATRMERYLQRRGGAESPMAIGQEQTIEELIGTWESNRFRHQQLLTQAGIWVPAFEERAARLASSLRSLRRDHATYGAAIRELMTSVRRRLDAGELDAIGDELRTFRSVYPSLAGTRELTADLDNYRRLRELAASDPLAFPAAARDTTFETDVVSAHVQGWLASAAPTEGSAAALSQALAAWKQGDATTAVAALESVPHGADTELVQQRIARYRAVEEQFQALQAAAGAPDYETRLVSFRQMLDDVEDQYFIEATAADYQQYRTRRLAELETHRSNAATAWESFRSDGGLPSVVRVEDRVSDRYVRQAGLLATAHAELKAAEAGYADLGGAPPADWQDLHRIVENEIRRQQRALNDLAIVLEPALLDAKLALLPQLEE